MTKENLIYNELQKQFGNNKRVIKGNKQERGRFYCVHFVTPVEISSITYADGTTGDSLPLTSTIDPQVILIDFSEITLTSGTAILYENFG
jgi:hypothetical protein